MKNNEPTMLPEWLIKSENYIPPSDKDTFVNKSILSLLSIISKIKTQDFDGESRHLLNVRLQMLFTLILIVLLSISRSFFFVLIINVYLLLILSSMKAEKIIKSLKVSLSMSFFTFIVMLPSLFLGNTGSLVMITLKVFASVTAVSLVSLSTRWSLMTGALKSFFLPDIFILVLDITIKYIVMLGDFTLNMLYSLKLRSVGKNRKKYTSMSGVAGTMFIKSKEMAEETYYAMECRGFTGEYHVYGKSKFTMADYAYIIVNVGIVVLFVYFRN